jgi:hypothetical protein
MQKIRSCLLISVIILATSSSHAITLLSGPSFVPATNAPLAGLLQLTTDVDSRVCVSVDDGTSSWARNFYDFSRNHSVVLAGFKPGRTNQILVTVHDQAQNTCTATQALTFVTARLPVDFPHSVVLQIDPGKMEPGYTLFIVQNRTARKAYITAMDNSGEVVWYSPSRTVNDYDVRQLSNGNLFIQEQPPINRFLEINLLGETVQTWSPPAQYPINSHDGVPTDHGTILYLSDVSRVVSNFPTNATDPNAARGTVTVDDNPVVEISATNGALLNVWAPVDMLDPTRVTYLTYQFPTPFGVDNEHANALLEDTNDNSIIVSLRDQNAVFKFVRSTGRLKWILGPHANWSASFQPYLLTPVGTPFQWNYGQHAPEITPRGTLLLYDNGNDRASPFAPPVADQNNFSRAVEYSINETNMEVAQVWDSSLAVGDRLFTAAVGDADWLRTSGNVLVTYGLVSYVNGVHPSLTSSNATMVRIREYTHDAVPQVVFDLSFFDYNDPTRTNAGYFCYRSDRILDLYAHPAAAVADLNVSSSADGPRLRFSADPVRTYTIEASSDLLHWTSIGTGNQVQGVDAFEFQDRAAGASGARFYRVVTH